jgi:regulatory protein
MNRIHAIEALAGGGERVELRLSDGRSVEIAYELLVRAGLYVGLEVTEGKLRELEEEDLLWRTRESAFHLLSYRARSRVELARRLERKGYPAAVIERCLAQLEERGLVDDQQFATSFARDRMRGRAKGARRIVQELRVRGIDGEIAEEAIGEAMRGEGVSEAELARRAAARWKERKGEDPVRARRRFYAFLARRGFGADAIRVALAERGDPVPGEAEPELER